MNSRHKIIRTSLIIIFCLSIMVSACQRTTESSHSDLQQKPVSVKLKNDTRIDSLKQLVLKGDKAAYRELYINYAKDLRAGEILLYSMQMAHKYNYPQAYDCIYSTFVENQNTNDLKSLDEQTRNLASYYLLRAYELGVDEKSNIEKEFGKNDSIPKSSHFLQKMAKYDLK